MIANTTHCLGPHGRPDHRFGESNHRCAEAKLPQAPPPGPRQGENMNSGQRSNIAESYQIDDLVELVGHHTAYLLLGRAHHLPGLVLLIPYDQRSGGEIDSLWR